eukprot:CAMPEP_0174365438 /NCGR_PEP_ID=MMETSP0811_2-20130205/77254_1 /TAXON_ID=73025 ORGANISM="Eutreptiella gymnastica-like, Strain CCMP1594" /NCGR_SAMPLE_ID=MMETSP0811_2 /ASSEMBLY_ACC=CAM_ASM_000667 /LENGTH=60 /DNA_ID=CAMNT_0015506081 /DNA_START=533 /DNA_END=715 /DNA_ORIENTATION=-
MGKDVFASHRRWQAGQKHGLLHREHHFAQSSGAGRAKNIIHGSESSLVPSLPVADWPKIG